MKTINSFRSKLLALTLALTASVASFGYDEMPPDFKVDGLYYNFLEGDNVEVTHPYRPALPTESASNAATQDSPDDYANLTELTIPSTVTYEGNVYHVTRIGHHAFDQCENLTSVDIPNSIKSIGIRAFSWCSALTSIVLKGGLENIESYAFEYCLGLENISLPNSLMTIGQNAFYNTQWYKNQPNGGVYVGNVFYKYKGDIPQNTSFVIKEGTVSISPYAFVKENYHEDYSLVSVSIPNSVKVIGEGAFSRCRALTSIVIPAGVTTIETLAFHYCKALKSVTCEAVNPPALSGSVFLFTPIADATLYVPAESLEAYKTATEWKDFGQILPIEPTTDYKSQWCNKWNVMWFDGLFFDETASTSQYRLGKDTVIGNYTYSKLTSRTSVRFTSDRKVYVYYEGFDDNDPYTQDLPTGEYLAYDFSAQVGDTLEVFSGIRTYSTYPCIVDEVQTDPETALRTITLHKICRMDTDGDGIEEDYDDSEMIWIEGVGSPEGFLISDLPCGWVGGGLFTLLCAYKDDELKYTGSFYERFGCDYNAGVISDDLFPTLSGLQRTICREYCEQADNKTRIEQFTNLTTRTETGAPYIYCSPFLLREKDNKILIYSRTLNKDLVLYDFNLQVGDSLPMLYIDFFAKDDWIADRDMEIWCVVDYHKDLEGNILPADTLIVTDVSMITLLDGKEYKKWTFNNGMEYVEGIGSFGNGQWSGDFFQLIANKDVPTCLLDEHLVCASRNNKLLYQMDDAEMEQLETECLCEYNAEQKPEDLFPTLWGLQRTVCNEYCGETEEDNSANNTYKQTFDQIFFENDKPYILCNGYLLREEDNKILIYSQLLNKNLVLYDFTLEVGDSLPALYIDWQYHNAFEQPLPYNGEVVDYNEDNDGTILPADTFIVTDISTITLLDGKEYKKWTFDNGMEYVEGIGMYGGRRNGDFFGLIQEVVVPCHIGTHLVCVSKNGKLLYQMDDAEMERLGAECLCQAEQNPKDLFPTLWGLQRTVCNEYCEDSKTSLQKFDEIRFEHDQPYIYCESAFLIREENNKILIYSHSLDKDLVLYDFTLEVGDSLPRLYLDESAEKDLYWIDYNIMNVVDYHKDSEGNILPADTLIVTDVSTITLLDGKEHKKWTFNNGMEYVEGIGSFGNNMWFFDFFQLIGNMPFPVSLHGTHLVCVSKNNKLLYQMDAAEMERLGAECLCDYNSGPRKDNAKDGQIGGRPTPTQWNQLEVVFRQMDNNHTILQAETFSYTLEDISQQVNNKTYFQLARQSTKDTATTKSVVGALHFGKDEDNRVYFLRDGVEYVLYDFTAEIGDTMEIFAGINNYPQETTYTHVVVDKDTTEDGACRMFLEVVFPEETTTAENAEKVWLAGLGSVDGIVHNAAKRPSNAHAAPSRSASSETESSVMLCAWREDSCLYMTNHPDYDAFGCVYNQDLTAVESPTSSSSYQKVLRGGQLLIMHNGKTYTVMGIEMK